MGNRDLLLDGNTGGAPADDGGEPDAFLCVILASAGLLMATLRRGR